MARPILMPQVGQDLTEGKIVALHVKLGDKVKKGDIVAEVESEKATFEVEAFETGTVIEMRYKVGDIATVLQPIMLVGDEGEVVASTKDVSLVASTPVDAVAKPELRLSTTQTRSGGGSSPLARRLAAAAGVDIRLLAGSGPQGAVVQKDLAAIAGNRPASSTGLRSLREGTGDPVVFIHGFGADLSAWRPFILLLSINNPILALDLPAHGANADSSVDGFAALTAAAQAVITSAGLSQFHLVGHSLGAAVAAGIAGNTGLDVRSLTLMSPAGLGPRISGDFIEGFLAAHNEPALKAWLELSFHQPNAMPGALVRATLAAREGTSMLAHQKKLAAGLFSGNTQLFSVREQLDQFAGPVRVVVGGDDRIIPFGHSAVLPPHVAVHRLPLVGHLPQLEAAELTARIVAETVRSAG